MLLLTGNILFSQINCSINITTDTLKICAGESIQINTSGNPYKIDWTPTNNLSDATIKNPIASPPSTTKYKLRNRYTYPDERITNGDFELGNIGFTSQYAVDCSYGSIEEGYYCVNNDSKVYYATWSDCPDHTSGSGNMMLLNASTAANVDLWCQNITVNPNTEYAFSTWITSVYTPNPAALQFTINGNLFGNVFNANPTTCKWTEFYSIWNSGANTTAQICIVNQNTIGEGNDFAMDDISFKPVCYSEDSVVVAVYPNVNVQLGADQKICNGDSVLLKSNQPSNYIFQWSTGANSPNIYVTNAGKYSVTIDNGLGCAGSDTISFSALPIPSVQIEPDTTLCFQFLPQYTLHSGTSALQYTWSTGENTAYINVSGEGTFAVTASNGKHCISTDSVHIKNYCPPTYFNLPNAFTPNGDGLNEIFIPVGESIYEFQMLIFNRWGELIFESKDASKGWDGKYKNEIVENDVYVVYYNYQEISPKDGSKKEIKKHARVTLVR